ncbi:endonuclease NucS [Candidatus Woesearchaeota archaeon]|nr:endonuclease NucS [Candidatus Woesearchaeota archaeon]
MELTDFKVKFEEAIARNESVVFFCSCEVNYSGRAEAFLARGDRMIIVKSDNTLLVHQPEGGNPINYMRPKSKVALENFEKHLVLKARNLESKDYIDVEIFRVYNFMNHKLEDGIKQELAGNEKDMSDMIKAKPELISKDFKPLSREEHTKFGFIDVFGHDKKGNIVIVECKRYTASLQCVTQLRRYVEKIKELKGLKATQVKGILASPKISPNAKEMLEKWKFKWVEVHAPKRLERFNKDQKSLGEW